MDFIYKWICGRKWLVGSCFIIHGWISELPLPTKNPSKLKNLIQIIETRKSKSKLEIETRKSKLGNQNSKSKLENRISMAAFDFDFRIILSISPFDFGTIFWEIRGTKRMGPVSKILFCGTEGTGTQIKENKRPVSFTSQIISSWYRLYMESILWTILSGLGKKLCTYFEWSLYI